MKSQCCLDNFEKEKCCLDGKKNIKEANVFYKSDFILQKGTEKSLGYDICSNVLVCLEFLKPFVVSTGLFLDMKENINALVCSRSGLATKGVFVLNSPGIIDNDYTGEVKIILLSINKKKIVIEKGSRIAQLVFLKQSSIILKKVNIIEKKTARGSGGFGHTGL